MDTKTSPLQAVFTQPTPVLSLGSELRSPSLSSQTPPALAGEQTGLLRLVSAARLRASVWESLHFALRTSVAALSSVAPKLPPCHPLSAPMKGLPSVWKPFLLHSCFPEVQVLSLFFCLCFSFFLLPYPDTWGVSHLLGCLKSSTSVQ